jgi:UDP-glucuronate decarboxylase
MALSHAVSLKGTERALTMHQHILVTGAAGFVGSHLCDRLLADGHVVWGLDNLSSGSTANLAHLRRHPRFAFIEQDVTQPCELPVQCIYNLACPASPPFYQRDPVATTLTSVLGTWQMLELARRRGARLLQASTSEIYGDPAVHPQPEIYHGDVNPIGQRACYDEGKRCAETLCFDFLRQHGTDVRVARIFNTYGPRMLPDDGRVVSNFVVQALRGEALTLYGSGEQTRSFCYVDDTVDGLVRLMQGDTRGPVNLGNPHEVTMRTLAEEILRLTGGQAELVHRPLPEDDPRRRCPDIALAQRALGWSPRVPLEQGLLRTIAYFRQGLATSGVVRREDDTDAPVNAGWRHPVGAARAPSASVASLAP